jgi:hypothetical protein
LRTDLIIVGVDRNFKLAYRMKILRIKKDDFWKERIENHKMSKCIKTGCCDMLFRESKC